MLEIAEFINPTPSPLWKLAKQAGVDLAVGGLPTDDLLRAGERPWDLGPLTRLKQRYEEGGFALRVIESRPPLNNAKRGLPGGEAEIDSVCMLLENMGKLGIPVWCYEWMTDFNWLRTNMATPSRGGSVVTSFDYADVTAEPTEGGPISEEKLWETLTHFLERVVPVAEKAGVKLSMHPRRSAPLADPRRRPHHALDRQLPAAARNGAERGQHDHPLPGQFHADDRRPAGGDPEVRQDHQFRPFPRRARRAAKVRGNLARCGEDRHARLHEGLPGHRLRWRAASRPRADRRG
jgi:hypothetical protein